MLLLVSLAERSRGKWKLLCCNIMDGTCTMMSDDGVLIVWISPVPTFWILHDRCFCLQRSVLILGECDPSLSCD